MGRFDLSDRQWARAAPHLPPEKPPTGRPNDDHRRILGGILRVLRTGAPWRDLPARYGPVGTVSSRFYRWRQAGVWDRVLAALPPPQAGGAVPEPGPTGDPGDGGDVTPPARRQVGGREDLDPAVLMAAAPVAVHRLVPVDRRAAGAQGDEGVMQARLVGLDPGEQGVAGPPSQRDGFFGSAGRRS